MWMLLENWKLLLLLFAAMLGLFELGHYLGRRRRRVEPEWDDRGVAPLESTVLALLGLLLAFTFSGAWSRFDTRRELILQEGNAIGTAWMRLDLVPAPARARMQEQFRRYVELRLEATKAHLSQAPVALAELQRAIWAEGVTAAREAADNRVALALLPALNEMFDIATARYQSVLAHPPTLVFVMLLVIMAFAVLLAGYGLAGGRHRHWLYIGCFVASLVLAIYVTLDLEYPRLGFIRVDGYDQLLVDLRTGMK